MNRINQLRYLAAFSVGCLLPVTTWSADTIDEIVVTADFRERTASELPASITVLHSDAIEGMAVQHFEELVNTIPNLNWSGDGHRARYFQIRGVGELEQYQGAPNPSVGFLIDDIDFSGIGTVATLFDMQQVEVLRGPQGTRYGANALAGLIYMRSAEPTAEFDGHLELSVGDDAMVAGGLAFGGGLSADDKVTFRLSAHHHESNGYRDNAYLDRDDTNGREETSIRGRLRWLPNDAWRIDVTAMLADVNNGYDAFALDNSYTMLSDKPGKDAQKSLGASVRAEFFGWDELTLTSITAIADSDMEFDFDADWGNQDSWAPVTYDYISLNDRKRSTVSQELRLASSNWLLGFYSMWLEDELDTLNAGDYYDPSFDFADSLFDPLGSQYEANNVAVFGQYDHDLNEVTRLTAGIRAERRSADYTDSRDLTMSPADSIWGGELTLSHDHSDRVTSYASLSKGYKAGGFNLGIVPADLRAFSVEELWNLETGIKSSFLDGALQLNAALFVSRRIDQQVRTSLQLVPGDPASFIFITVNADRGDTLGFEADVSWYPTDSLRLYANLGLLDATFEDFDERPDLKGRGQAHAPDYTLAFGGSYRHPSGVFARLDVSARDEFYFDVSHDQESTAYELVNARLGYEASSWTIQLWARNLFNEDYAVRGFYFGNEPPDFPNTLYTRLGDPRQLGVTFDKRFQ
jgi:outer membrane receptor protein involved in Fe transport